MMNYLDGEEHVRQDVSVRNCWGSLGVFRSRTLECLKSESRRSRNPEDRDLDALLLPLETKEESESRRHRTLKDIIGSETTYRRVRT